MLFIYKLSTNQLHVHTLYANSQFVYFTFLVVFICSISNQRKRSKEREKKQNQQQSHPIPHKTAATLILMMYSYTLFIHVNSVSVNQWNRCWPLGGWWFAMNFFASTKNGEPTCIERLQNTCGYFNEFIGVAAIKYLLNTTEYFCPRLRSCGCCVNWTFIVSISDKYAE